MLDTFSNSVMPQAAADGSDQEIIVNGGVYYWYSDGLIHPASPPEPVHSTTDYQNYYHSYDTPVNVDNSALGAKLHIKSGHIDLSKSYEASASFGGHSVEIIYDASTMTKADLAKATEAIQALENGYNKLTSDAKDALNSLQNIVITTQGDRSFSQEDAHTFVLGVDSELRPQSEMFSESDILHDAEHIHLWDQTHDLNTSRGLNAEVTAIQLQLDNASALGLSAPDIAYLQDLHDHPEKLDSRVNSQP